MEKGQRNVACWKSQGTGWVWIYDDSNPRDFKRIPFVKISKVLRVLGLPSLL